MVIGVPLSCVQQYANEVASGPHKRIGLSYEARSMGFKRLTRDPSAVHFGLPATSCLKMVEGVAAAGASSGGIAMPHQRAAEIRWQKPRF
jgi:hypothetical protein